jgi:hypothetical protein
MDPILFDLLAQILNDGKNAITQKNQNNIIATISFLDTQIANAQAVLEDDSFKNIEEIVLNQTRRIELFTNFKRLFQTYLIYLQQTNGIEDYTTWQNRTNDNSFFTGKSPKQYIESLQPIWYTYRDADGDGNGDEIIPQFKPNGQTVLWSESPMPSAILYRTIRGLLAPASGTIQRDPNSLTNIDPAKLRNVGACNDPKYSYRIRQIVDPLLPQERRFYGYSIAQAPKLVVTVFAACPNTPPTELFTITVDSNIFWKLSENSEGNFVPQVKDSLLKAIGKIKYGYYFNLQTMFEKVYAQMNEIALAPLGQLVYDNIKSQLSAGKLMFVDNFGPQMGSSPGLPRAESFYKPGTPPSGFVTSLPEPFKTLKINNQINWYTDVTGFGAMNVVENFFFMGGTEYGKIKYDDIKTTTTLTGEFTTGNDWNPSPPITPFINARVTGEVENKGTTPTTPTQDDDGPTGFNTGTSYEGTLAANECGETVNTQNPYYGKVSWKFKINTNNDCSSPCLPVGFGWRIEANNQFSAPGISYEYPQEIRDLIQTTTGGEATGPIIDVLRGPRDSINFQKLLRNGLTPLKNSTSNTVVTIPGYPCLKGVKSDYQWGIKRKVKIPYRILCGNTEIDYRNNESAKNWLISFLARMGENRPFPAAMNPTTGQLLTTSDGYFYSNNQEEMVPIVPRVSGEPGVYFSSFSSVSFDRTSLQCVSTKTVESSWRVDLDNPCGCDEVEILTHYLTYPEVRYTDPLYGTTEVFPEQKVLDREYPAPDPASPAARYSLGIGQELTNNRRQKVDCFEGTGEGRLHHPFLYGTDILPGMRKRSIKGLFNLSQSLECYHTSSEQSVSSKEYYYSVTDCDNCGRTSYFAVAYGHKNGSGSLSSGYEKDDSPSRAIYSQYRLLALDPHEKNFTFYDGGDVNTPDDIYVINYYRNGLSDKLDIGNFEINIAELSGSGKVNIEHTGSKVTVSGSNPKILSLIDNSAIYDSMDVCSNDDPLYSYEIVSGSLTNGIHSSGEGTIQTNENLTTYGKVYPNLGVIVLDGHKLNVSASFNSVTGSNLNGDNSYKLFTAISGAAVLNKPMRARNVKFKTTNHYFVRIPSSLGNYSNNPTWVIESGPERGKIRNACFVDNPITYITTIGLYNSKGELLAVAKLSKPIKKSKENDVLVKVRLNW